MDESHAKANVTRRRNQEIQQKLYREKAEATRAARTALQRALESPEATPAEIIRAAELLVEIGRL